MTTEKESRFEDPQGCTTLADGTCVVHLGLQGGIADLLGMLVTRYPGMTVYLTFLPIDIEVIHLQNTSSTSIAGLVPVCTTS